MFAIAVMLLQVTTTCQSSGPTTHCVSEKPLGSDTSLNDRLARGIDSVTRTDDPPKIDDRTYQIARCQRLAKKASDAGDHASAARIMESCAKL